MFKFNKVSFKCNGVDIAGMVMGRKHVVAHKPAAKQ
jgi:hypothetical protein